MRTHGLVLLALCAACSFDPPGTCGATAACGAGLVCQSSVCVACPSGLCPVASTIPSEGEVLTVLTTPFSSNTSVSVRFPPGSVPAGTQATVSAVSCKDLPPLPHAGGCITAFKIDTPGVSTFSRPITIRGGVALKAGVELLIAELVGGAFVDAITAITGSTTFRSLHAGAGLVGILSPGTYVVYQPGAGVQLPPADFGVALVPDDGAGKSGLQVITLLDDDGAPLATPTMMTLPSLGGDLDGAALTPDGSQGVMVDGANSIVFFSGVGAGQLTAASMSINVQAYGGDGDAIAIMPDGDEAVVSADGNALVVVSGITLGAPMLATTIPLLQPEDGLVISDDGHVMLGRGYNALSVFSIDPIPQTTGPLGGRVRHSYSLTADLGAQVSRPFGEDGRDGLAISSKDSSRAVVVGSSLGTSIQLLTGLPGSAAAPPTVGAPLPINGAGIAWAVAITPDGTRAIVGTDKGLVMFGGVDTGSLAQLGAPFDPMFTNVGLYSLSSAGVPTLGISLDERFVTVLTASPDFGNGTLLMFPILDAGFGPAVAQLNGVAVPSNDQLLMH